MEVKPWQIVTLAVGAFTAIVAANFFVQWRSNESFRKEWENVPILDLLKVRRALQAQENMETLEVEQEVSESQEEE
jgi:hypothetical protein